MPTIAQEQQIAGLLTEGQTGAAIAQTLDMSESMVSRTKRKPDIKALVRKAQETLINASLDTAISNQTRKMEIGKLILSGQATAPISTDQPQSDTTPANTSDKASARSVIPTVDDKDLLALADRAENRLMQSIGLAPSHTLGQTFIAISNSFNQSTDPAVLKLLAAAMPGSSDVEDVIDVDLELD